MQHSPVFINYTEVEESLGEIDFQMKRLVDEGCRRNISIDRRLEIRRKLTDFRRMKRKLARL